MNFGTILNSVTKKCVTLMVESKDREAKANARNFIKYVHLKEVLAKQFRVYHQLNSSFVKDRDSAKIFVAECLSTLDDFKFKDILGYNHLIESKFHVERIKSTDINIAIADMIKYRTTVDKRNQNKYIDSLTLIVDHVTSVRNETNMLGELDTSFQNSELKFLQPRHVIRIALKKFNDRYTSKFDLEDRKVFDTLREGDEQKVNNLFKKTIMALEKEMDVAFTGSDNLDLANKLQEAYKSISTGYTQSNLLDAHELCSELKRLREDS